MNGYSGMPGVRVITQTADDTHALGVALGRQLQAGDVIGLSGELGAGKTVLAQGLSQGLDVTEPVSSPTFSLVHEYQGRLPVWHLDTYRVASLDELIDLSWSDLLSGGGVVLIEWPERIRAALPPERLDVSLHYETDDEREIELIGRGERWREVLSLLRADPALGSLTVSDIE